MFLKNLVRFAVVVCSRGWGKSFEISSGAVTSLFELFELLPHIQNKRVAIIAPTFDQVKDIYYPVLTGLFQLPNFALKESKDLGRFIFPNDVELHLLSYEAVERMRGKGYYFVGWDEVSSCTRGISPKEAWEQIIYPTISTRWSPMHAQRFGARSAGRAMFASTPKGFNFLHELYTKEELNPGDWKSYVYDYTQTPLLDRQEIEKLRDDMDPISFASEYLAQFKESGNSVFYCFDRKKHVQPCDPFMPDEIVYASIDFNVGLMCTGIFAVRGGQMQFIAEMKGSPDTEQLALRLRGAYPDHDIIAFPDPTGKARKSSSPIGRTDFSILKNNGITICAREQVPVVDSVNAVNKKLLTASGKIDMFFDPIGCPEMIRSMERTKWADKNPEVALIDKSESIEHFSDGVRYATEYLFPIKSSTPGVKRGFAF